MATKDGFQPDHSPIFLSEHAEETGQPDIGTADIGKAWQRAAISSRILKASIWAIAATAIGIAILSVGDPVALLENLTATWVEKPALQPVADPPAPAIQSFAATLDLPTTTSDAPARDEIAAASEPADQNRTEIVQPPAEVLLKEFEAWAANKDTQAEAVPVQPAPVAPVQVVQDAPVQVQPAKKHRRVRPVQNARAEIRPQRHHRARVREEQNPPVPAAPVPDARAPEQAAQTPWLLQGFGLR